MAKPLVLVFEDVELPFFPEKVDRAKIYGSTSVHAQDEAGNRCSMAMLSDDGRTLIGECALGSLSAEGEWVDKKTLKPVDAEGKPITPVASSFNAPVRLVEVATIDDYLAHNVKSVYQMRCDEGDLTKLFDALRGGKIFRFPFSFRGGLEANVGFLLLGQDQNLFMAVGEPTRLRFVGLEQAAAPDDEAAVDADDDESLDFGMM